MTIQQPFDTLAALTTPFNAVRIWLQDAADAEPVYPEAAQLATVDAAGMPNVRTVLIRRFDESGFVFFTNLSSAKGRELAAFPKAALVFYWKALSRQLRARGEIVPVTATEADAYFAGRPRESQIGAHASKQSDTLTSRETFEKELAVVRNRFASTAVPRPVNWSGFRLIPTTIEFWQERPFRLHDRLLFEKSGDDWHHRLLYP